MKRTGLIVIAMMLAISTFLAACGNRSASDQPSGGQTPAASPSASGGGSSEKSGTDAIV